MRDATARAPNSVVADRRSTVRLGDAVRLAEEVAQETRRVVDRPDPVVVVALPSSTDAVVQVLAAVLGAYTLCILDPSGPEVRLDAVVAALDPDLVVSPDGVRILSALRETSLPPGYVAMSSGSTGGSPKAVLSTWDCLGDFAPHGVATLQLDRTSRWAEPSHPGYDLAMTNWLLALASGSSLHVTGALADRLRPLGFAARVGATHVRVAPRFVELAAGEHERGVTASIRVWGSGGDRLSRGHAERVLGMGIPILVNTYGTSETAGFASAATFTGATEIPVQHGSVSVGSGQVGPWRTELVPETVDAEHTELLVVSSPHVGAGYLFGGEDQVYPRWESGTVVTGDLGASSGDGLFCLGRAGRLVKRSATFVNLDDIDLVLREDRGLDTYTVATRGGELVTLVAGPAATPLDALREMLAVRVSPDMLPDALVPVAALPMLGNGKVDQAGAVRLAERSLERP